MGGWSFPRHLIPDGADVVEDNTTRLRMKGGTAESIMGDVLAPGLDEQATQSRRRVRKGCVGGNRITPREPDQVGLDERGFWGPNRLASMYRPHRPVPAITPFASIPPSTHERFWAWTRQKRSSIDDERHGGLTSAARPHGWGYGVDGLETCGEGSMGDIDLATPQSIDSSGHTP